jgi:hypothetical protein
MCEVINFFEWCDQFTSAELKEKIMKHKARKPFNSKANQEKDRMRVNKVNVKYYKGIDNE